MVEWEAWLRGKVKVEGMTVVESEKDGEIGDWYRDV